MYVRITSLIAAASLFLAGCASNSCLLEPEICYIPQQRHIASLPSAFPKITKEELRQEWAKELLLGQMFARELDLYRAITCYKRALFLIPEHKDERRLQLEFTIFESYYLADMYRDALDYFQESRLVYVDASFCAYKNMLLCLYDCYLQTGKIEKAEELNTLIREVDEVKADNLELTAAIFKVDMPKIYQYSDRPAIAHFLDTYECSAKSVRKAQLYNALMPGAGYLYVGQKKTALTSFILNSLFIGTAAYLFYHGNVPGGLILTSLEMGWYIGGINGAGLAAKEYNQGVYSTVGKETMIQSCLFPVLMFETAF